MKVFLSYNNSQQKDEITDKIIGDLIETSKLLDSTKVERKDVEKILAIDRIRYILKSIKIEKCLLNYISYTSNERGSVIIDQHENKGRFKIKTSVLFFFVLYVLFILNVCVHHFHVL